MLVLPLILIVWLYFKMLVRLWRGTPTALSSQRNPIPRGKNNINGKGKGKGKENKIRVTR